MCNNSNPSGAYNGYENLLPQGYRLHAIYLATVARHALVNWGITFQTVEAFNEPDINWAWNGTQVGCPPPCFPPSSPLSPHLRYIILCSGYENICLIASHDTLSLTMHVLY